MKKKRFSYLLIIIAVVTFACSSLAYANEGSDKWFSPYRGRVSTDVNSVVKTNKIAFDNLSWDSYAVGEFDLLNAWELEFRYNPMSDIFNSGALTTYSQLPSAYFEDTDPDDRTFGSHSPQNLTVNGYYDGYMTFTPSSSQPSVFYFTVESELGLDGGVFGDAYPIDYDVIKSQLSRYATYTW